MPIDTVYTGGDGVPGKWQFIWKQLQANFAPLPDSPCLNRGVMVPGVTEEYTGTAPDVGAVEGGG